MNHINFIETKSKITIKRGKLELDYWMMILITASVFSMAFAAHLVLGRQLSAYQQELALIRQSSENEPIEKLLTPITSVVWSDWLKKYATEFPRTIRLNRINATLKEGKKIVLEATGQSISDASHGKKNLLEAGLCGEVNIKTVHPSEEGIVFELECALL